MARAAAKRSNRKARREQRIRRDGCVVAGCLRRGNYKIDLENGSSQLFCSKHYGQAAVKGFFRITQNTQFEGGEKHV